MKIVVCISGGGSNLQAILDAMHQGIIRHTSIACVISNNAGAFGLERAKKAGIKTCCLSPKDFTHRQAYNQALLEAVMQEDPDYVVLAGFLVAIPPEMVKEYPGRILNIHPSLIPSFCGTGYYGLRVHEAALSRGVRITGATVHFVDEGMDTGPILLQKAVQVLEGDTPEILQKRVMEEAEWILLPEAIRLLESIEL